MFNKRKSYEYQNEKNRKRNSILDGGKLRKKDSIIMVLLEVLFDHNLELMQKSNHALKREFSFFDAIQVWVNRIMIGSS